LSQSKQPLRFTFYKPKTLYCILAVTACIHIGSLILSKGSLADFRWQHLPIHSSIEMLGTAIALWVAWTLISVNNHQEGTSYNLRIAAALIAMGLLDGFHALWHVGNEFVWLHSLATLFGGAAFASILIDRKKIPLPNSQIFSLFIALSIFVGLWPLFAPNSIPAMTNSEGFSLAAKSINILGGILFLVAGAKLFITFKRTHKTDDFLFCLHCILFGSAAIMFEQSKLWDLAWWGWHILRFLAYGVALIFIIQTEIRMRQNFIEKLEDKVQERTNALSQANKRLERFASMASHDLKEPLRTISSFSGLLNAKLESQLDESSKRHLQFINDGARHGLALVDDIMQLSKNAKQAFSIEAVHITDILEQVKNQNAKLFKDKNAEIELINEPPELCSNANLLYQICSNLISNGIKYNDSPKPKVSIIINEKPEHWEVDFKDNGIGIKEEHFKLIFEEFSRLHAKGKYQGTGLGLATCMDIAKRMGGDLTVQSEVGQGSTFTLSWPKSFTEDACKQTGCQTTKKPAQDIQVPLFTHVLLIEDNQADIEMTRFNLENSEQAFTLDVITDGEAASDFFQLIKANSKLPDIILLDVNLPKVDGFEVLRIIKQQAASRTIPVIMLSAYDQLNDEQKAFDLLVHAYIPKPIDEAKLLPIIETLNQTEN